MIIATCIILTLVDRIHRYIDRHIFVLILAVLLDVFIEITLLALLISNA